MALQMQRLTLDVVGEVAFSYDFKQADKIIRCVLIGFLRVLYSIWRFIDGWYVSAYDYVCTNLSGLVLVMAVS